MGAKGGTRGYNGVRKAPPMLVQAPEIAHHLLCDTGTLYRRVAVGDFPPPHSRLGDRMTFWWRPHWDAYLATGQWPEAAFARKYDA